MLDAVKIKAHVQRHYDKVDILKVTDVPIEEKVDVLFNQLITIYKGLVDEKLLPETITLDGFMQVAVKQLEIAMAQAQVNQAFGGIFTGR